MPRDNKPDNSSKRSTLKTPQEQVDDSNTLHEQLKKIKEDTEQDLQESSKSTQEIKDIENPVHDYCS